MKTSVIFRMTVNTPAGPEEIEFSGEDIVSATLIEEVNILSTDLPWSEIEFTIYSTDPRYSFFSDGAVEQSFAQKQPVIVTPVVDDEERESVTYFLSEWFSKKEFFYTFRAVNIIGVCDTLTYDGGFWEDPISVSVIISDILNQYNLNYFIDESIGEKTLKGYIRPGTVREALQQVAFACGASVTSQPIGTIAITEARVIFGGSVVPDLQIVRSQKIDNQTVNRLQHVDNIELISHAYLRAADAQQETIYEATLEPGNYKIVYDSPYYGVDAIGVGYTALDLATEYGDSLITEGGDNLVIDGGYTYGSNYMWLTVEPPGGYVKVTGYKFIDYRQSHVFQEQSSGLSDSLRIENATLVSPDINADSVLAGLANYYRQRFEQQATIIRVPQISNALSGQKYGMMPYGTFFYVENAVTDQLDSIKINDCVDIQTISSKTIRGIVEQLEINLSGGMLTKLIIRGVEYGY